MSQYDHGKHHLKSTPDGRGMSEEGGVPMSKKRLDAQKPPKNLLARQASYDATVSSLKSDAGGFNKPGSQQRRSK